MSPHDDPTPRIFHWLTPSLRRYVYGIALAVMPLLTAYGIVSDTLAPLWVAVLSSVLVPGLALAHTPSGHPHEARHRANELIALDEYLNGIEKEAETGNG